MKMQDVVHDLLLEHGYNSPKDRVVDMICYVIPKDIKAEASVWGWSDTCVRESVYAWMKTNIQRGND